jgi:two-component system, NtrC family, sensor kinase
LLGFAELGLRSSDSRDKDEALQRTVTASMHGRGITAGLLTFARQGEPQRASHDLREAVSQALALVERDFQRRQIAVVRQIDEVSYTVCDLGQIIQVVLNLLSNARDAMAEQNGGMVRISLEQHGDQIELAISDSGHGIPEELQQQIFQPFMTTKGALGGSATPGTGLGLAISYGIIESHGGTITVRSKPGEGATFIVRLPVVDELALREQANERSAPTLEPLQLLVIDDDQLVREAMVALLKRQHHNVEAATSGEDALRLCGRQSFDVAICDPAMSGIAGVELIERLQMLDPLMGMVLVTGNPQSLWGGAVIGGHMPVLHKPCSADDLLWAIADASHARPVPKRVLLERRRA